MNIGFYGHSNCAYRSPDSFLDLVANYYNGNIVNIGCKQGSEERVLFELKKTKRLDVAVIFHCHHSSLFIPNSDRDVHANSMSYERAEDLFSNDHLDIQFTKQNNPKFKALFKTNHNLYNTIEVYKQYLYHQDLVLNRYYGSLMQIDQYLISKKIKSIHVLDTTLSIPSWFKFHSGIVDYTIMMLAQEHRAKNPFYVNCISQEGNRLISEKLIHFIKN